MITRRNIIWILPALLLFTFPFWKHPVAGYLSPPGGYDPDFSQKKETGYNFYMEEVNIKQMQNGRQSADINAQRAQSTDVPFQYILIDITADILDKKGTPLHIVAEEGIYDQEEDKLQLINNVVITNTADNYTMKTDLLFYNGKEGVIHSPSHTEIAGDGMTVSGSTFDHDMNSGSYLIEGRVFCTIAGERIKE